MDLCDTCEKFSRILLGGGGLYAEQHHLGRRNRHLSRARDLVASATSCSLCELLLEYVIAPAVEGFQIRDAREKLKDWLADAPIFVRPCNDVPRHTRDSPLAKQEYLTGFKLEVPLIEGSPELDASKLEVDVWAEEGSPATENNVIGSRRPLSSPCSDAAMDLIAETLRTCREEHAECKRTIAKRVLSEDPPNLPTRVIDLEAGASRLKVVNGEKAHYAALSHRWGEPHQRPMRTTKSNLNDHMKQIPQHELTSMNGTFDEAITVTRRLGLRYLWIDSLCIIQDDEDDWRRESERMGSVYQNAQITIAASSASCSKDGLWFDSKRRTIQSGPQCAVRIPYIDDNGSQQGFMFIQLMGSQREWSPDLGPLGKRGWIMQEWLLARRILFYTYSRIIWRCNVVECDLETRRLVRQNGLRGLKEASYTSWESMINQYSARVFTYKKDRLVALQGLAAEFQRANPSRKLAYGLWMDELPRHLLWRGVDALGKSPAELAIPTWSWASKDGAILLTTTMPLKNPPSNENEPARLGLADVRIECGRPELKDGRFLDFGIKLVPIELSAQSLVPIRGRKFPEDLQTYDIHSSQRGSLDWIQSGWLRETLQRHLWIASAGSHTFIHDSKDQSKQIIGCAHLDEVRRPDPHTRLFAGLIITDGAISVFGSDLGELGGEHAIILQPAGDVNSPTGYKSESLFERIGEGWIKTCRKSVFELAKMEQIRLQ